MRSEDVPDWLATHVAFAPLEDAFEWDIEAAVSASAPDALATDLCRFAATGDGKPAAMALAGIARVLWWVSCVRDDAANAKPRVDLPAPPFGGAADRGRAPVVEGGTRWIERFADTVLAQPGFIGPCALAYNPPLPLGEQHFVDTRLDALLAARRKLEHGLIESLADDITSYANERRSARDAEVIWWAVQGGSLGLACRLVRFAEIAAASDRDIARRPAVTELRRVLVAASHDPLIAGVPFWARAWMIEHLACCDRRLLEDLVVHEQEPWLADQMRFELALPAAERVKRWASWLS